MIRSDSFNVMGNFDLIEYLITTLGIHYSGLHGSNLDILEIVLHP